MLHRFINESFCPIKKLSSLFCKYANETSILQRTNNFLQP